MSSNPQTGRTGPAPLRCAFNLLYNQFAWAYDWVSGTFFRGQWHLWQRAAIAPLREAPGQLVLEVGCGTGDLQVDLRRAGYVAYGVDLSPAMLRITRRKARRIAQWPRLARAATEALPFPSGRFDAVVSTFPSEYILDPHTLDEIARVLRPGGILVVVPFGLLLPVDPISKVLDRFFGLVYAGIVPGTRSAAERRERLRSDLALQAMLGPLMSSLLIAGFDPRLRFRRSRKSIVALVVGLKRGA